MTDRIVLTYRIETPGSVEKMATKIASDQSTGTFVPLPGETPELKARVAAEVLAVRTLEPVAEPAFGRSHDDLRDAGPFQCGEADIAFPIEAIGPDLAALMTIAIGGTYSIKGFSGIRVTGLTLPPAFARAPIPARNSASRARSASPAFAGGRSSAPSSNPRSGFAPMRAPPW